jgi:integrase
MGQQAGELIRANGSWHARYYVDGKRRMKKIGRVEDYPTRNDIFSTFQTFMAEINDAHKPFRPDASTTVRAFVTEKYFPTVEKDLRGSTMRGYKAIWNLHIDPRLGTARLRDVVTFQCQQTMDAIVKANPELKQATLSRVKSFMHAFFAEAIRLGLHEDTNPASAVKIRGAQRKGETHAYSLADIKAILGAVTEPSKVVLAVAAYSGLRRGEIIGLKWEDYDGERVTVRRNICFGEKGEMSVELPKTESSSAPVPVIAPLRKILDAWKAKAEVTEDCWVFQAGFTRKKDHPAELLDAAAMTPLSPNNLLRDSIIPALEKKEIEWRGYHAFRRGLATNLRALNVDDLTIMEILRHSDVAVTRASYIKRVSEKSIDAMERFEIEIAKPTKKAPKGVKKAAKRVGVA